MTLRDLKLLADYHEVQAQQLFTAAKHLTAESATDSREMAAQHLQWSEQLKDLHSAFTTLGQLTKE